MQVYGYEVVGWEEAHAKEPKLPAADPYAPSQLVTPLDSQQQQQQQQQPPPPSAASKASPLGVPRHGQRTIFNVRAWTPPPLPPRWVSFLTRRLANLQHQGMLLRGYCRLLIGKASEGNGM